MRDRHRLTVAWEPAAFLIAHCSSNRNNPGLFDTLVDVNVLHRCTETKTPASWLNFCILGHIDWWLMGPRPMVLFYQLPDFSSASQNHFEAECRHCVELTRGGADSFGVFRVRHDTASADQSPAPSQASESFESTRQQRNVWHEPTRLAFKDRCDSGGHSTMPILLQFFFFIFFLDRANWC